MSTARRKFVAYCSRRWFVMMAKGKAIILGVAVAGGLLWNLAMPQGINLIPEYVQDPLWRPAPWEKAMDLYSQKSLFVDARSLQQYGESHIWDAVSLPADEMKLMLALAEPALKTAKDIVVYGRTISRWPAAQVGQELRRMGYKNVWVMEDSFDRWQEGGYPTTTLPYGWEKS